MAKVTANTGLTLYTTELRAGEFIVVSDEPSDKGGQGKGPAPLELLAAALASCTSITLRMYAGRKAIDTGELYVNVEIGQDESGEPLIKRSISAANPVTSEQARRFEQIAALCPVSKMLSGPVQISTTFI